MLFKSCVSKDDPSFSNHRSQLLIKHLFKLFDWGKLKINFKSHWQKELSLSKKNAGD